MALISEIRKRSWLVFIFIGLALVGFLVMDGLNSSQGAIGSGNNQPQFAEIDGAEVSTNEYNSKYQESLVQYLAFNQLIVPFYSGTYKLDRATEFNLKEEAWNNLVQEKLLNSKYDAVGISLTEKEKENLIYGQDPHNYIKSYYVGLSQTGQYDPQAFLNYVNYVSDPNNRQAQLDVEQAYLDFIVREKLALRDEMQNKYLDLMRKVIYTPQWMAQNNHQNKNGKVNFDFIEFSYADIADETISISDNEASTFYEKNKEKYKQEESRIVEYVSFPIIPTSADSLSTLERLNKNIEKFTTAENDSSFLQLYSESQVKFNRIYHAQNDMYSIFPDSTMADEAFAMEEGSFMGPYFEGGFYKVAKLLNRFNMPDSALVRHILVGWPQEGDSAKASVKADSILNLLNNGADFGVLAKNLSDDTGSGANGGDLGWSTPNNNFVRSFAKYIFQDGIVGEVGKVRSQFGYHLIEIQEIKERKDFVNVIHLTHKIYPSAETEDSIDRVAGTFFENHNSGEKFNQGIADSDLRKGISPPFTKNQFAIVGIPNSREVVLWAYSSEKEDFKYFPMSDRYLVAYLSEVNEEGYKPLENAREEVESELIKIKKAEAIAKTVKDAKKDGQSLSDLAEALSKPVKNVPTATYSNSYTPQTGQEPKVIGTAFSMDINTISEPIAGNRGVFVIYPREKIPAPEAADLISNTSQISASRSVGINIDGVINMLKEQKKIVDNRYMF